MLCKFVSIIVISAVIDVLYAKKVLCDLDDAVCVTKVCKDAYPSLIAGFPEVGVEPLDPVRNDIIKMELPDLKFTLTGVYLYGLKDCIVNEVRIHQMKSNWDFYLECPSLTLKSNYEIHGKLLSLNIDGKGSAIIVYDAYHIKIKGEYDKILLNDGAHMKLKNYVVTSNIKGKAEFNFTNLYDGDNKKSAAAHTFLNENWAKIIESIQEPIISSFMRTFFDHLNKLLDILPTEELFTHELD